MQVELKVNDKSVQAEISEEQLKKWDYLSS
mgnify:CR=1 FL=1|jgi:hypothetical protein